MHMQANVYWEMYHLLKHANITNHNKARYNGIIENQYQILMNTVQLLNYYYQDSSDLYASVCVSFHILLHTDRRVVIGN